MEETSNPTPQINQEMLEELMQPSTDQSDVEIPINRPAKPAVVTPPAQETVKAKPASKEQFSWFWLILILVLIAGAGIVTALVLTRRDGSQTNSDDAIRRSDVTQIATDLEVYAQNQGNHVYPDSLDSIKFTSTASFVDPVTGQAYTYTLANNAFSVCAALADGSSYCQSSSTVTDPAQSEIETDSPTSTPSDTPTATPTE